MNETHILMYTKWTFYVFGLAIWLTDGIFEYLTCEGDFPGHLTWSSSGTFYFFLHVSPCVLPKAQKIPTWDFIFPSSTPFSRRGLQMLLDGSLGCSGVPIVCAPAARWCGSRRRPHLLSCGCCYCSSPSQYSLHSSPNTSCLLRRTRTTIYYSKWSQHSQLCAVSPWFFQVVLVSVSLCHQVTVFCPLPWCQGI